MKVETHMQSVTVTDIPNVENLTSVAVNLQDMTVELLYKGYVNPYQPQVAVQRYDGELDPPFIPFRQPEGGYRPGASTAPRRDHE